MDFHWSKHWELHSIIDHKTKNHKILYLTVWEPTKFPIGITRYQIEKKFKKKWFKISKIKGQEIQQKVTWRDTWLYETDFGDYQVILDNYKQNNNL